MSRGLGGLQRYVLERLADGGPQSIRELAGRDADSHSWRMSLGRALRTLATAGKLERSAGQDGVVRWRRKGVLPERWRTAVHEAGHAIIGMWGGVAIGMVTIRAARVAGFVSNIRPLGDARRAAYDLESVNAGPKDIFGRPVKPLKFTPQQHEAQILYSMAGGIAEREICGPTPTPTIWKKPLHLRGNLYQDRPGDGTHWRDCASPTDYSGAAGHRGKLAKPKSWEVYERQCVALVRQYEPLIRAVAQRLVKQDTLTGHEVEAICARVVRRQHLKSSKVRTTP